MTAQVFRLDSGDIKLILIGALAALIATGVSTLLVKFMRAEPFIVWSAQEFSSRIGKHKDTIRIFRLIIENSTSVDADNVVVTLPAIDAEFKVSRRKRRDVFGTDMLIADDQNFKFVKNESTSTLTLPKIQSYSLAMVIFATSEYQSGRPTSVTFDGKTARMGAEHIPFLRHRDFVKSLLRNNWATVLVAVLGFALGVYLVG